MKRILLLLTLLAVVGGVGAAPNVLFLVVDDLRPKLNCYGESNMVTPNIDNLAARSVLFDNAYVQQALCSPSRTSFLTGRRPDSTRTFDLETYFRKVAGNFTTLPQHFKDNGYLTWSVGKIYHPGEKASGFDDNAYSWSFPAYHAPTMEYRNANVCRNSDGTLHNNAQCPVDVKQMPGQSLPDIQIADTALQFLRNRSQDKHPFFLGVGFHKPHLPFKFPQDYLKLYPLSKVHLAPNPYTPPWTPPVALTPWTGLRAFDDIRSLNLTPPFQPIPNDYQLLLRQSYSAAVSYTDYQVGRVLHALDQYGLTNNTIVSFLGDHGWQLGEHNEWCKQTNYDIATRIPMLIHIPGVTSPRAAAAGVVAFPLFDALSGTKTVRNQVPHPCVSELCRQEPGPQATTTDALVEAVDLYATLSELVGLEVPPLCPHDPFNVTFCTEGTSLVPVIRHVITRSRTEGGGSDDDVPARGGMTSSRVAEKVAAAWKPAVFSQYPRPSDQIQSNSPNPLLADIRVMGYTMKTAQHRYTEWVAFDPSTFLSNFSHVHALELYVHSDDFDENVNVAYQPVFKDLVQSLSRQLRAGWRGALPKPLL
ncbi:iduronate 2-sulfatase-like isoform X2 [Babylonia areolata]|uniref:iduronate 2-sulfatase-like isoform X2 n=1 Tax=Babylonia areolata TaxID=304850 RepID=UPI003FD388F0